MEKDLKWIKKHYGEKMMHLCRSIFPRLLETEGLVPRLLEEHFAKSKALAEEIISQGKEDEFKSYLYSFVDVESEEKKVVEIKTAEQLFDEAGYILFPECKSEEEIQRFKEYYAKGEALCTFRGGRLDSCRVWFAVKKDLQSIKRAKKPSRQDEYGTSVISIQFTRRGNSLSIKNRYNHTVNNPDNTFNSNLDNIIPGLTDAFERDFGVRDEYSMRRNSSFELEGFVNVKEKHYRYNYEINNIYYCDNNIIIDNFEAKTLPSHQMLVDYFIFDFKENKVFLYDKNLKDGFIDSFGEIESLEYVKPNIIAKIKDGKDVIITINEKRQIVGLKNENVTETDHFMVYNNSLTEQLSLPSLTECGEGFLYYNNSLTELNLPSLTECGDDFLYFNKSLTELNLPNLTKCGSNFLYGNNSLTELSLPNLTKCGTRFLYCNKSLTELNLPSLTECGEGFLYYNNSLAELNLPNLSECGDDFLYYNKRLTKLDLPSLTKCEQGFMYKNKSLTELNLPSLTKCGNYFLFDNNSLTELNLPNLTKCGNQFLYYNKSLTKLDLPSLTKCGEGFLQNNKSLKKLNLPKIDSRKKGFLKSNKFNKLKVKLKNSKILKFFKKLFKSNKSEIIEDENEAE